MPQLQQDIQDIQGLMSAMRMPTREESMQIIRGTDGNLEGADFSLSYTSGLASKLLEPSDGPLSTQELIEVRDKALDFFAAQMKEGNVSDDSNNLQWAGVARWASKELKSQTVTAKSSGSEINFRDESM